MRDTFYAETTQLLRDNPRTALVLADISAGAFATAARRHPDRVLNVGIREQLMMSVGGGLALTGLRPIVHSYATFLIERAWEQIKLDLRHQDVGAVLVSVGASYDASTAGRTHHAPGDIALLDTLDGVTVHVPGHPGEVGPALRSAGRRRRSGLCTTDRGAQPESTLDRRVPAAAAPRAVRPGGRDRTDAGSGARRDRRPRRHRRLQHDTPPTGRGRIAGVGLGPQRYDGAGRGGRALPGRYLGPRGVRRAGPCAASVAESRRRAGRPPSLRHHRRPRRRAFPDTGSAARRHLGPSRRVRSGAGQSLARQQSWGIVTGAGTGAPNTVATRSVSRCTPRSIESPPGGWWYMAATM